MPGAYQMGMTKEQMMKSHATITCEEPCFHLSPKDMRTRASMLAAFQRQIDWMVDFDHAEALEMNAEYDALPTKQSPERADFYNFTPEMRQAAINGAHALALEINAMVDTQKAPRLVHLEDLAHHIDKMREKAQKEHSAFYPV